MTVINITTSSMNDSRVVEAAEHAKIAKEQMFWQVMRIWLACQDKNRGVLSTREMANVLDTTIKLEVIRAMWCAKLLTSPSEMRGAVAQEWLEVWSKRVELEVEAGVIAASSFASETEIQIRWDHYLYVNGSLASLAWRKGRVEAGKLGGKASVEARKQKQAVVNQGQAKLNQGQAVVNQGQAKLNQGQAVVNQGQAPLEIGKKHNSQIPQSFNQAELNQPQADLKLAQANLKLAQANSSKLKQLQASSSASAYASSEAEEAESANAPEGARQPSTPLKGVSAGNSQPAERGEDWYASVAHRALKSFQMRSCRFPVELSEDKSCGADDAGELADYVVGTYSFASLIAQVAKVEITDFQTPSRHTLSKLAKLINTAAPEDWCHGSWRVLGALLGSALIWVQSGQEYYKPVIEKFLLTQVKFKSLARPKADYIRFPFAVDGRIYRDSMFRYVCEKVDQIAAGDIDQDFLEDCIFGYSKPFPTPICDGFGKDTKVKLVPLPISTSPAQTESETPARIAETDLESTEGDQDGSKCQPTSQSILEPNAPLSGPTVTLAACNAVNFTEDHRDDHETDYSYESGEDQEFSEMPTQRH